MRHMPSAAQEWQWGFPFPQAIAQFLAHPYNSSCLRQKKLESQMLAQWTPPHPVLGTWSGQAVRARAATSKTGWRHQDPPGNTSHQINLDFYFASQDDFIFFATLWWWNLFPNSIKKSNNIWKRLPSQHCDWLGMLCPSREELCLPHTGRGWTRLACLGYGEQCSDPSAGKMIAIRSCAPPVCPRASFELWMQKKSKSKFGEKPSKDHQ